MEHQELEHESAKAAAVARGSSPITFINLFQHPDAHPYVLDLALLREYGPEWMEWEREVLELRILSDFPTAGVSDLAFTKLHAVKALHYTDSFWNSWEVFVPITMALNSLFPDFQFMQVPTVSQCAMAVDTALRIRGEVAWSEEIKAFLSAVFKFDGIFCPTEPLDFVEVNSSEYLVDCAEIRAFWPVVRKTGKPPDGETITAEQLRRMLLVNDYVEDHRARLQEQVQVLRA